MRAAIALLLLLLCVSGAQAGSAVFPELSISLSPGEVSVAASPNYQEVRFNGNATLDDPAGAPVVVSLFSRVTEGWYATCTPNIMNLYGSGPMPFNLTVRVDAGACNKTALAWVEGEVRFNGGLVSSAQSQKSTINLGDLPGYTVNPNRDSTWLGTTFSGNIAFSPATALLVVIVLIAAAVGYGLVRRRRRKRGARS